MINLKEQIVNTLENDEEKKFFDFIERFKENFERYLINKYGEDNLRKWGEID